MNKIIPFVLILFLSSFSLAQEKGLNWVSLEEAEQRQKENPDKKIFVNFYATWCGFCRKMDKKTFTDKEVIDFLNENYILVKFDAESKKEYKFKNKTYRYVEGERGRGVNFFAYSKMRGKLSYPTSVILDDLGFVRLIMPGYLKPDDVISSLENFAKKG